MERIDGMRIAISAKGQGLDAPLDPRFGRSHYFFVMDTKTGTTETLTNKNATAPGGAGIQTAQFISDQGIEIVITGSVGPKAAQVLAQAEIKVHSTNAGTVREAIQGFEEANQMSSVDSSKTSSTREIGDPKRGSNLKVAIATEGDMVAPHFGHCPTFTIITVKDSKIQKKEVIPNPGHKPGFLPRYLNDIGIDCIIAGGMGGSALQLFAERGIKAITGIRGLVDDVATAYVAGQLQAGESLCNHDH
jgi:predicted Fe-Mo cluster-binding NifX family protein